MSSECCLLRTGTPDGVGPIEALSSSWGMTCQGNESFVAQAG